MIGALLSGGASILSGVLQHKAGTAAQKAQEQAANRSIGIVDQTMTGMNQGIADAATAAGQGVSSAAEGAAVGVNNAAAHAAGQVNAAAQQANAGLNPYAQSGAQANQSLLEMLTGQGARFDASQLQMDPGYQHRLNAGADAIRNSMVARGLGNSGAFAKRLTEFSQGAASQEFQNAFNRHEQTTGRIQSGLTTLTGMGYDAASRQGSNTLGAAQYGGDMGFAGERTAGGFRTGAAEYQGNMGFNSVNQQAQNSLTGAGLKIDAVNSLGNAQAAGAIGRGNAWSNAIGGVANAAQQYSFGQMLKAQPQPQTQPGTAMSGAPSWVYQPVRHDWNA